MAEKEVKSAAGAAVSKSNKSRMPVARTLVYIPERAFLAPYLETVFGPGEVEVVTKLPQTMPPDVKVTVMISATKIYHEKEGENIAEDAPLEKKSFWTNYEGHFRSFAASNGLNACILRAAYVIGTGMTGFPMWLARGIYGGWLVKLKGNDSRVSVVHAVDVAELAKLFSDKLLASPVGTFVEAMNVSDGSATTVNELIDALAFRINDKKVWTVSGLGARLATLFYDKHRYDEMTTTLTFDDARLLRESDGYNLHRVTEYLRTHNYNADSL